MSIPVLNKLLLGIFLIVVETAAFANDVFVFTAIPDQDETQLRQRFDKVAAYLTRNLGVETQYIPVKSYAAAVTAFRNDQVQLASFPRSAFIPASNADYQPILDVAREIKLID